VSPSQLPLELLWLEPELSLQLPLDDDCESSWLSHPPLLLLLESPLPHPPLLLLESLLAHPPPELSLPHPPLEVGWLCAALP
jgi:hypothetical protein